MQRTGASSSSQELLPLAHVDAAVEFPAYLAESPDRREAELLVEPDALRIRQRDAADRAVQAACLHRGEQRLVERAAETAALRVGREVDRALGRETIGRAALPRRGAGITRDDAVGLGHEVGILRRGLGDPPRHLGFRDRLLLESD